MQMEEKNIGSELSAAQKKGILIANLEVQAKQYALHVCNNILAKPGGGEAVKLAELLAEAYAQGAKDLQLAIDEAMRRQCGISSGVR